ncbi:multimeric flavodoxin WrbA [Lachnospiraceae bacterium PM6-15]|uniref:flavodoxin family protein n=1 Tax=Ohessyouella blattaphilus TaxID=2949333 RepID=UPI003E27D3D0
MKVLLLNGSPRKAGCTFTALTEIAKSLEAEGIDTEIVQAVDDSIDYVKEVVEKFKKADALVVGSPVYYASPTGAVMAFLDKFAGLAKADMRLKPAAVVASARRAGTTATLDALMKYLTINEMPIVSSNYWTMVHGNSPEEVLQDIEGIEVMQTLGKNMAWLLKSIEVAREAGLEKPEFTEKTKTNFIR